MFLRGCRDGIAGSHVDQRFCDGPRRSCHFRQAVLANVRAVGELIFEVDSSPGADMVGGLGLGEDGI